MRLFSSSDRNSGKMFHSRAVDGKALVSVVLFSTGNFRILHPGVFFVTRKESILGFPAKPKHLHMPMEGSKFLPASAFPSAFTNSHALELMIVN